MITFLIVVNAALWLNAQLAITAAHLTKRSYTDNTGVIWWVSLIALAILIAVKTSL